MKTIWNPGIQEWLSRVLILAWLPGFLICSSASADGPVRIGSKKFTESYVLGEVWG